MHIPDGFVNVGTAVVTYAASAGALAYNAKRTNRELDERQVPLMGVMAAFVFAAQMINFRVAGGTSGHLLGGALVAILLGPWAGSLVLTAVLVVQALLFQDGGIMALGANVLNMAVVGVWSAHLIYTGLRRLIPGDRGMWPSAFVAAWTSVVLASAMASLELALSGISPLGVVLPAMVLVHMLIGVGEGLITTGVLGFLAVTRKDLLHLRSARTEGAQ
ncbi:MAG: energy-coupling factor ABC transporter permease [Anaerolineae bacterium]